MSESPIQLRDKGGRRTFQGMQSPAGGGGSPPYDPASVSGLALWLDALDASTINAGSPTDGDAVSTWADKSGNGYDAVQADGAKQPTWTTDALTFDGSQYLAATAADLFRSCSALTVALVVTLDDSGNGYPFATWIAGAGPDDLTNYRRAWIAATPQGSPAYRFFSLSVSPSDDESGTPGLYDWRLRSTVGALAALVVGESADIPGGALATELAPDQSETNADQHDMPRVGATTATATGVVSVGGDAYLGPFTGRIAAVLAWNRFLDATERRELNEYLCARYAAL